MTNRTKQPFGQILMATRRSKNLSLAELSKKLQIPFKYLEALEFNHFKSLPAEKVWKKFLKKYCSFLSLNFSEIYKIAREDFKKSLPVHHRMDRVYLRAWPKVIRMGVILIIIIGILVFLGLKVNQIFMPPPLEILQPQDGSKTYEKQIKVAGKSRKEAEISINNNLIFVDANGNFDATVDLQKGLNLIKITAKKKYSRVKETDLRILLSDPVPQN